MIDGDTAARPDLEPGAHSQVGLGAHSDGRDHELGGHLGAVVERDRVGVDPNGGGPGVKPHPVALELARHRLRHLGVEAGEDLRVALDDRGRDAAVGEVLGHLQPDVAGAEHDRRARSVVEGAHDPVEVVECQERLLDLAILEERVLQATVPDEKPKLHGVMVTLRGSGG